MSNLSESWLMARASMKDADDAVAKHDWERAEQAAAKALGHLFDFKLSVIAEKQLLVGRKGPEFIIVQNILPGTDK